MAGPTDIEIARVFAEQRLIREQQATDVLNSLTTFERRLAGEVAVMGWVRGFMHAQSGAADVGDFPKLPVVVEHCQGMPDLYPIIAALSDGLRPEDPEFVVAVRRHSSLDSDGDQQ